MVFIISFAALAGAGALATFTTLDLLAVFLGWISGMLYMVALNRAEEERSKKLPSRHP